MKIGLYLFLVTKYDKVLCKKKNDKNVGMYSISYLSTYLLSSHGTSFF